MLADGTIDVTNERLRRLLAREEDGWSRENKLDPTIQGEVSYRRWRDELLADPDFRAIYEEEAVKGELWLQLVEAR